MKTPKIKLTAVSTFHYVRLVYRSLLFLAALFVYISYRVRSGALPRACWCWRL